MRYEKLMRIAQCCQILLLVLAVLLSTEFARPAIASEWQDAYKVRVRLLPGQVAPNDAATRYAFIQIELEPNWKTYWRNPGEGGGIPPEFNWAGSENLKEATVLYPAPRRLKDTIGDTIGYKDRVTFPVRVTALNATAPLNLALNFRFGICKDICVPTELTLKTDVLPVQDQSLIDEALALDAVPRNSKHRHPNDPEFVSATAPEVSGDQWAVILKTRHADGATDKDLFLEAPAGIFIPVPKPSLHPSKAEGRFKITLSESEYKELKGKLVRATVVDSLGASQSEFKLR